MAEIISITNQKGGVGKTTTAVNLASSLGKMGFKTLLIDIDPQGNATSGVGINKREITSSSYDLIYKKKSANNTIIKTKFENLSVIPSNMNLAGIELEIIDFENRESCLKNSLSSELKKEYDYIIIDCSPSLGLLTINAFCASNNLIIPMQCEYYALEGLSQLFNVIRYVKRNHNQKIDVKGILLTMYDGRLNLTQQVASEIKKHFPKKVFKSIIPRTVRISEAPSFGKPIIYFDQNSKGTIAYLDLAKEISKIGVETNEH